MQTIKVGVIGASPDRGWARTAHVPALRALPQYEISAVGTTREESAREAARLFGAPHAFTDPRRLAAHPDVDLVAVTVKVPHHAELIRAALDAGKHVLSEWPLALTTAEAESLAEETGRAGVHHAIGLQARHSPAIAYARELLADGYIGQVTSVNVYAARSKGAGGRINADLAYTVDRANGAGVFEVAGGHTLDILEYLAGEITEVAGRLSLRRSRYTVVETGQAVEATSPDHVLLDAVLATGAVASVHLHDAKVTRPRTRLEFAGTEGDLVVITEGAGRLKADQIQIGAPRILAARGHGSWQELPVPARHRVVDAAIPDIAVLNVAQLYARFAEDIGKDSRTVPGFDHAVRLHRLLDAVRLSADTGTRQPVPSSRP
ncbi:oxidoreductase [Actinomadura sp. NBRC 104425]|uniref:Gfo/Idh/MocA family protein n=1 Tax=Actinomadura sp. NBRC 104425 TaxID=3032204 RepID=UPI0024A33315|nr:Gfo/Idh/MocA family oxidoreductase [Actinomadura sp. NBRC 104425]GLZ14290.1 oxidoreductase [Actinomadura sp. NBRC 104425]